MFVCNAEFLYEIVGDKAGERIWNHVGGGFECQTEKFVAHSVGSVGMVSKLLKTFIYLTESDMIKCILQGP